MVRKISVLMLAFALAFGLTMPAHGASYTPYDGTVSNTYITYFKDIVSGMPFNADYVAFRADQNAYILVVGDLEYSNGKFALVGDGKQYTISSAGNYNSYYSYDVAEITDFDLSPSDKIIYSNLGDYLHLIDRGSQYETLSTLLIVIAMLCVVVGRFFRKR